MSCVHANNFCWFDCYSFLNPLLYKMPADAFNDITTGDNKCTEDVSDYYTVVPRSKLILTRCL